MKTAHILIKRNVKLFFKDKGMFFTALITPAILLVLYATFLAKVYRDSFLLGLSTDIVLPAKLLDGVVGGQLASSLLAVSCVTVSFCSNFLMVQDKANGTYRDLAISPVRASSLSLCYYVATLISSLIVCLVALALSLGYIALIGWYLSVADVLLLVVDVVLLVLFGTALSSLINHFLSTQGQISAVGTIVSSGYGFISGAYMPIASFGSGLQHVIACLPGTYGTVLLRNHAMRGALAEMERIGVPADAIAGLRDAVDCNLYFFDTPVTIPAMYAVLVGSILLLIGAYVLLSMRRKKQ